MKSDKLLCISNGLNAMTMGLVYPVLAIYMSHISDENYFFVGIIIAIPLIIMGLMSFGWGTFSDYIGERKKIVIITTIIGSLLFFTFPFLNPISLIIFRIIQIFFLTSIILINALMTEYFPEKKGRSVGNLNVFAGLGWGIGGIISGFVVKMEDIEFNDSSIIIYFIICGIISLMSALVLLPIKEIKKKRTMKKLTISLKFGERKQITFICLTTFFLFLGYYMVIMLLPLHLEKLEASTKTIGYFVAVAGVVSAPFGRIAGNFCDKYGRKKILLIALIGYIVIVILYTITTNIIVLGILWALPFWPLYMVASTTMVSDLTKESERGRGVGLLNFTLHIGCGGGALLAGILANDMEFQDVFAVGMVFILISLGFLLMTKESLVKINQKELKETT